MGNSYQVKIQGVDPGLTKATGSYDPIDLGTVDAKGLAGILEAVSRLELPEGFDQGEDVCVPSLVIEGPRGLFQTNLADDEGTFYSDKLGGNIGMEQIMLVVTGEPWTSPSPRPAAPMAHSGPIVCPSCGDPLEPTDQFCAGCGAKSIPAVKESNPRHERQKRKGEKRAKAQDAFRERTGKDFDQMNDEILHLMANPLRLRDYRERFPVLLNGETDPAWDTLREFMFTKKPAPPIHARLTSSPRDWAIQKPGFFRRLLTVVIDLPLWVAVVIAGVLIGEPLPKTLGFGHNSWGEGFLAIGWYLSSFIGYYSLPEYLLGASPGGLLMGLRVVDDYGRTPTLGFLIGRQIWKILDVFFMFVGGASKARFPVHQQASLVIPEFMPGEVVLR